MWKPPAPPDAPKDAEQLLWELADYYRELVEYHQEAAKSAYVRLTQVEALIGEPKIISVSLEKPIETTKWEEVEPETILQESKPPESTGSIIEESQSPKKGNFLECLFDKEDRATEEEINKEIEELLRQNRGKILQIDYIERELRRENLKEILIQGEKAKLWAAVPDAPGCWTLDLKYLAESTPKSKSTAKKSKIMPQTGRIKNYQSLTNAVAACLEQSYPNVCTNRDVAEWLYPKGLTSSKFRQVKESVDKVLSKGEGDLWKRVSVGKYVWKRTALSP